MYSSVSINAEKNWKETKKVFDEPHKDIELENLREEDSGRLNIRVEGVEFETCFIKKDPKKLIVFFSGPGRKDYSKAEFWKKSYSSYFEDSSLYIIDPCNKEKNYAPTFFFGSKEKSYMSLAVYIVKKFKEIYQLKNNDIVFIGESNTGLVALYSASLFEGSQCIALSPIVEMRIYLQVEKLLDKFKKMFDYDFMDNKFEKRTDITKFIVENKSSKYFIISNIRCKFDEESMKYLLSKFGREIKIGLNVIGNLYVYITDLNVSQPHLFNPTEGFVRHIYNFLKDDDFKEKYYLDFDALNKSLYWYRKRKDETESDQDIIKDKDKKIDKLKKDNAALKKSVDKIKSSLSYRLGNRIVETTKRRNPLSYLVIPFVILSEYLRYLKDKKR